MSVKDYTTIALNETVCAEKAVVGDYDRDGIPDLTVKFDREQVCALLEPGEAVEITVSGSAGDVRFTGKDTVRVIGKKNGNKKAVISECYKTQNTDRVYFYHPDHLGTPQAITDEAGNIVWQADYKPFGEAEVTTGDVKNNFRFPGQYFDEETGLHYNWHRYYDPATGRYLTADPIGLEGGVNLYAYASNNPINMTDPSGLDPVDPNTGERSEVMGCHHTEKVPEDLEDLIGWMLIIADFADLPSGEGIIPGIAMILGKKGKGFTGGISKTVKNIKIGKDTVRVDVEYPTGGSIGNVHIQIKGPNKAKIYLDSIDDLQNLPKSIRKNPEIQRALERAFEQLSKAGE